MARGLIYTSEYIRVTEREKALKTVAKVHKAFKEKLELVKEGKLVMIKTPIERGFTIKFIPVNEETN